MIEGGLVIRKSENTAQWQRLPSVACRTAYTLVLAVCFLYGRKQAMAQANITLSGLEFQSSNQQLTESFRWAKEQALEYVRSGKDTIGPWYEAALPGRNAFCMRDVSHQAEGAAALGLFDANRNMLKRFAVSAAPARNWAAFWEIDGDGKPSEFDYDSDNDFWFDLPANFDLVDAATRMWRWTGDRSYIEDDRFQTFYRETFTGYIAEWDLQPESILSRPRIVNTRPNNVKFAGMRGIPSYTEHRDDCIVGTDLLAAEYRALRSYQEVAYGREGKALAERLKKPADEIQQILETAAWSEEEHHFYAYLRADRTGAGSGDIWALYFNATGNSVHVRGALDFVANPEYWKQVNIEEESYVPTVLFRFGREQAAYQVLFDLANPAKQRREYPEVSYSVISAIVTGAMGIEPGGVSDGYDIRSLAQPQKRNDRLTLSDLRIKSNLIDISHDGDQSTCFVNREGRAIRWRAVFKGSEPFLIVNGKLVAAMRGSSAGGTNLIWTTTTVFPGEKVVVSRKAQVRDAS
jgi:hypothetical protein